MSHTTADRRSVILDRTGNPYVVEDYRRRALAEADLDQPLALVGSFQGTGFSRDRGYVYNPTLDSKREVDSWSRTELNKRARFVYAGRRIDASLC